METNRGDLGPTVDASYWMMMIMMMMMMMMMLFIVHDQTHNLHLQIISYPITVKPYCCSKMFIQGA
jgi:hypothetical protein